MYNIQEKPDQLFMEKSAQVAEVLGIPCISLSPLDTYTNHVTPAALFVPVKYWYRLQYRSKWFQKFLAQACSLVSSILKKSEYSRQAVNNFFTYKATGSYWDFYPNTKVILLVAESFSQFSSMSSQLFPSVSHMESFSFCFDECSQPVFALVLARTSTAENANNETPTKQLDTLYIIIDCKSFFGQSTE